jgi:hypothetical protein
MSNGPLKCLTFDGPGIAAALRLRFPGMDGALIDHVVVVATKIVDLLWHAREAHIAERGQEWRGMESFAEVIAYTFNLESMTQSTEGSAQTINLIHSAVHSVYCHPEEHQGTPSLPPDMRPPGSGGFDN